MASMRKLISRIYLIRHGSTPWNEVVRFRVSADIPLSEKGHAQAEALSRTIAHIPLAAVYSSQLLRARETAAILADSHHLIVQFLEDLRSVNYGSWEGHTEEEVA
jgi:broad specificity phosphatase PhoE